MTRPADPSPTGSAGACPDPAGEAQAASSFDVAGAQTLPAAATPDRHPAPAQIDRYRILRELGRGGMGIVYLAHDPELQRDVALKVLPADPGLTELQRSRFQREARAAARISHPNVVATYDVGDSDRRPYLTMEHVRGGNLAEWLKSRGSPPPELALRIMLDVCDGVAAAHEHGVLHRDLKPENILLEELAEGGAADAATPTAAGAPCAWPRAGLLRPKVTDFGLARLYEGDASASGGPGDGTRLTASRAILGTPAHMSPEQAAGDPERVDFRSDVYALGSVLYELLCGRPPFEGRSGLEVLLAKMVEDAPSPRRHKARLAADVETIVLECLDRDPARRYPTARELAADLRRYVAGEAILARPPRRAERLRRWVGRNRVLASACGGLSFALLALVLLLFGPARLEIASPDPGAALTLNGRPTGRATPWNGAWIWPAGTVSIEAQRPGFPPVRVSVQAPPLRTTRVTLPADCGTVSVDVTPADAEVALEQEGREILRRRGSWQGLRVPVGTYVASVAADRHRPWHTAVEVAADRETRLPPVRLEHDTARLTISTSVEGAIAWVYRDDDAAPADGRIRPAQGAWAEAGEPMMRLPLPISGAPIETGTWRLVWRRDGYFPRQTRVRLEGHDTERKLHASLERHRSWEVEGGARPALVDVTGDGRPEVALAVTERLRALSGGDGRTVWTAAGRTGGRGTLAIADLDQDGILDLSLGTVILSGRDGSPLPAFELPATFRWSPQARPSPPPGTARGASHLLADLNADGTSDLVLAPGGLRVMALSGTDHAQLWSAEVPDTATLAFRAADLDGDGAPDPVVSSDGGILALSGRDGHELWRNADAGTADALPSVADLDGDGAIEVVVASGTVPLLALEGRDGRERWRSEVIAFLITAPAAGDLDADGTIDVVVPDREGIVHAVSGRDGKTLWTANVPPPPSPALAIADVDRDGAPEVLLSCANSGILVLRGRDGARLWSLDVGHRLASPPLVDDLDEDGWPEVVVEVARQADHAVLALRACDAPVLWSSVPLGGGAMPFGGMDLLTWTADLNGDGSPDPCAFVDLSGLVALSGADGAVLWRNDERELRCGRFALAASEGLPAIVAQGLGAVLLLSGRDGAVRWRHPMSGSTVRGLPAFEDVDGDGNAEVLACEGGEIRVLRADDGSEVRRIAVRGAAATGSWVRLPSGILALVAQTQAQDWLLVDPADGRTLRRDRSAGVLALDFDGDRLPESLVREGRWVLRRGSDGEVLWTSHESGLGEALAGGDLDGDGVPDLVNWNDQRVIAVRGKDGTTAWNVPTAKRVRPSVEIADLDRDGCAEVIVVEEGEKLRVLAGKDGREAGVFALSDGIACARVVGDQDGDGVLDLAVGTQGRRCVLLSGRARTEARAGQSSAREWAFGEHGTLPAGDLRRMARMLADGAFERAGAETEAALASVRRDDPQSVSLLRLATLVSFHAGDDEHARKRLDAWRAAVRPVPFEALLLDVLLESRAGRTNRARESLAPALATRPIELERLWHRMRPQLPSQDEIRLAQVARETAKRWPDPEGGLEAIAMAWFLGGNARMTDPVVTRVLARPGADLRWFFYRAKARFDVGDLAGAESDARNARALVEYRERADELLLRIEERKR